MRANPLRDKWASGQLAWGGWLTIPSSVTAEAMAAMALDYLCIDMQHGLVDYSDSVHMLQAITLGTATPLVRVPANTPDNIAKALDAGAMAIIVPMVNSRAQAESAVAACYYVPKGSRSYGPARVAAVEGPDYYAEANNAVACIPMIETVEALSNIDEILTVDGIEAIYVGPSDLAISMGHRPVTSHPDVTDAFDRIVAACGRHDVVPGIHATPSLAPDRAERGFRMITVVADLLALKAAAMTGIAQARGEITSIGESLY